MLVVWVVLYALAGFFCWETPLQKNTNLIVAAYSGGPRTIPPASRMRPAARVGILPEAQRGVDDSRPRAWDRLCRRKREKVFPYFFP